MLLGDNTDGGEGGGVMLRPIRFQCVGSMDISETVFMSV